MKAVARRERLIENLVRLRHAERASPASNEVTAVRADLEEMAGPTVTRAMTARLLGVSQTALERWIATGDIPVLLTPSGRSEAPLHAVLELIETVREHRAAQPADRHPLGSVLRARRAEAERLNTSRLLSRAGRQAGHPDGTSGNGHRAVERRGLAYHRAVARRLDEQIVRDARSRLTRWRSQDRLDPRYARAWEEILAMTPTQIAQTIAADTPGMRDLRQNSPFAGSLNEPERRRVLAAVHEMTT
ncbi:MAG TPA: hypothetical protein VES65_03935 [Solirubrobacteraceae bacterium]|nr:hypothetical protein [Solirubrobacteraceae bacterium]